MPFALAAPPAILAAIFALLFLLAWNVWGPSITNSLNVEIPIGPWSVNLFGWVANLLDGTYQLLVYLLDGAIHPIVNFIIAPINAVETVVASIYHAVDEMAAALSLVVSVSIPGAFNNAYATSLDILNNTLFQFESTLALNALDTANAIGGAVQAANHAIVTAEQYTDSAIAIALHNLPAATLDLTQLTALADTAATSIVNAAIGTVESEIDTAVSDAHSFATTLFGVAETDIARALATAEQFTTTAIAGVAGISVTDIDHAITGALSGIYTDIDQAVTDVIDIAVPGDIDIIDALKALPAAIPVDIAGLAALTGITTLALTRYLRDCGIPNCTNLSQYGKDLQALLGIVGDASFLALLIELIDHPSDAAATFADTFGDAVSTGISLTNQLLGV